MPLSARLDLMLPAAATYVAVGRALAWGQFVTLALAGLVLQGLAPGFAPRAAVFFLTPLTVWKGAVGSRLDRLPWLAAGCGLAALWLCYGFGPAILGSLGLTLLGSAVDDGAGTLLAIALAFALACAAVGLWMDERASEPARWAALAPAVPIIALAVFYARVGRIEADPRWGLLCLLLAAPLTPCARLRIVPGLTVPLGRGVSAPRQPSGTGASGKEAPETLVLRGRPRPVTRLSRRAGPARWRIRADDRRPRRLGTPCRRCKSV